MCDVTHSHILYQKKCPGPPTLCHDSFVTWLIHMCDMTHLSMWLDYVWYDTCLYETWLIYFFSKKECPDLSRMCHDSFLSVIWLIHMLWHDSFIRETWLIHICEVTYSYVWHDSFTYEKWFIHIFDVTHSYVWHDSLTRVTWLAPMGHVRHIRMCDMTHSYVWHDSFICVTWLIHMCDMTHSYVWHDSFICATW